MTKRILVTSALIYANGPAHLGHMVETIQTDIWVRAQKYQGHNCTYLCGSDAHGTPIMLSAQKQGITPEELVMHYFKEHQDVFKLYHIEVDQFISTHSPENEALVQEIYNKIKEKGDIVTREVTQAYDEQEGMFLPDRFVKGTCPKCHAPDQYGDNCEACGATYSPADLLDPISVVSGSTPTEKSSVHYFFALDHYQDFLKQWLEQGSVSTAVANKLDEWLQEGLCQWDISRDAPYFGFKIPGETSKFFYVWLDAPIGYLASLKKYCDTTGESMASFTAPESEAELYHFIGKDIINFHALFWPAMLNSAGYRLPDGIFAHGFLTIDGKKMSKSRGTFITAEHFANHLNTEQMRYYLATKLGSGIDDLDLNFDDFILRVNGDLVGKVVNIASRCAGFIHKKFDGRLAGKSDAHDFSEVLLKSLLAEQETIITHYNERDYHHAVRTIMALADQVNQFIDQEKPWALIREEGQAERVHCVCSTALNAFKILMTYLKPILPHMTAQSEAFLQCPPLDFTNLDDQLFNHNIAPFTPLMQRVDREQIDAMLESERPE